MPWRGNEDFASIPKNGYLPEIYMYSIDTEEYGSMDTHKGKTEVMFTGRRELLCKTCILNPYLLCFSKSLLYIACMHACMQPLVIDFWLVVLASSLVPIALVLMFLTLNLIYLALAIGVAYTLMYIIFSIVFILRPFQNFYETRAHILGIVEKKET